MRSTIGVPSKITHSQNNKNEIVVTEENCFKRRTIGRLRGLGWEKFCKSTRVNGKCVAYVRNPNRKISVQSAFSFSFSFFSLAIVRLRVVFKQTIKAKIHPRALRADEIETIGNPWRANSIDFSNGAATAAFSPIGRRRVMTSGARRG